MRWDDTLHPQYLQAITLPCRLFTCVFHGEQRVSAFALQDALKLKARLRVTYAIWSGSYLRKPNVTWISFTGPSQSRGSPQFQHHSTRDRERAEIHGHTYQ